MEIWGPKQFKWNKFQLDAIEIYNLCFDRFSIKVIWQIKKKLWILKSLILKNYYEAPSTKSFIYGVVAQVKKTTSVKLKKKIISKIIGSCAMLTQNHHCKM